MIARIASFAIILFCPLIVLCDEPLPQSYLEKIDTTPDFCQVDQRFGNFPGDGLELCAPVSMSNSLIWLSDHGFPKIMAKHPSTKSDQADLIRLLCSAEFLNTNLKNGTPPSQVVTGLEKFMKSKGYDCVVEQMGWRSSLHRIGKIPDEKWMLKSCMGSSSVLINVGWYKLHENTYKRKSGHWITLVGFKEEKGSRILYVHDPSKRSGIEKKSEACHLVPIPTHHSLSTEKGESISGDGYFQLQGIHLGQGADHAIIDEAVAFKPILK